MAKILGIDYGARKVGIAIADTDAGFVFARPPILLGSVDAIWPALQALIQADQPIEVVVGLPKNTDGTEGEQAEVVRMFVTAAAERITIPVHIWDERLTTQAVQREQTGRQLPRGAEDSLAAQIMLENYLASKS